MSTQHTLSRRSFIQTGAAVGTAALFATAAAQEAAQGAAQQAATPNPVRIGIVGVGSRGSGLLATMLQMPGVEVPAVCDIKPERATAAQDAVEKARGKRPEAYGKDELDWQNLVTRDDLDAVVCATPWEWHTPISIGAMRAGKYAATEVPAAGTLQDCWDLVKAHEETGIPCMMLENVNYFQNVLTLTRMVREGLFGELSHAEAGYQHDCRFLSFTDDGQLTWRGERCAALNGNLYPTHPIGPIAWWFNINRGDRFTRITSVSTPSRGFRDVAARRFGADHPLAKRDYALGDVNTSIIKTQSGKTVTLYFDMGSPRPYDLILRLQGTKGIHHAGQIYLEGVSPQADTYEPFEPYMEKYPHPLWTALEEEAKKNGGHGGSDYVTLYEFIKAVRTKTPTPQDVYDAATWSAIVPLTIESVANDSAWLDFPDFTNGKWKTNPPIEIVGA